MAEVTEEEESCSNPNQGGKGGNPPPKEKTMAQSKEAEGMATNQGVNPPIQTKAPQVEEGEGAVAETNQGGKRGKTHFPPDNQTCGHSPAGLAPSINIKLTPPFPNQFPKPNFPNQAHARLTGAQCFCMFLGSQRETNDLIVTPTPPHPHPMRLGLGR